MRGKAYSDFSQNSPIPRLEKLIFQIIAKLDIRELNNAKREQSNRDGCTRS